MVNGKRRSFDRVYSAGPQVATRQDLKSNRTASLPPGTIPPSAHGSASSGNSADRRQSSMDNRGRPSESSSESDSPTTARANKDKKSGGLMGLFRRKKATQL